MTEEFFRSYARINVLYPSYIKIAIEHYANANNDLIEMENCNEVEIAHALRANIENNARVSIVFAAMCIEAILNDYAATRIGDNDFYFNFEKLSPENKLYFILRFILNGTIDKSQAPMKYFKDLFKHRNDLVHSKSKAFSPEGAPHSLEDIIERESYLDSCDIDELPKQACKEALTTGKSFVHDAFNGLRAIKGVAELIDSYDEKQHVLYFLFSASSSHGNHNQVKNNNFDAVWESLGVKGDKFK